MALLTLAQFGEGLLAVLLVIVCLVLLGLLTLHGGRRTAFGDEIVTQAMSYRRFLRRVTQSQLLSRLAQDSQYFYRILPYAEAIGLGAGLARTLGNTELEVRDLLSKYDFDGDNAPIIRGSALGALNGEAKWEDKVMELMDAVDSYIPLPQRDNEKPFLMPVEDVFSITGRGTVLTGRIETGVIKVGDPVEIIGLAEKSLTSTCTGVEMFRKLLDEGEAGDNVGLLMRGIDKKEVKRGMVVAKPGSITPHTKFEAEVYILKKEEGGRHTPFHHKYRPQFYLRTLDVTGEVELPEGVEMVMPGDNVSITVTLIYPVALNVGLRFAIREGGRTVGAGQITKIIE